MVDIFYAIPFICIQFYISELFSVHLEYKVVGELLFLWHCVGREGEERRGDFNMIRLSYMTK